MKKSKLPSRLVMAAGLVLGAFAAGVGYAQVGGNFGLTWSTVDSGGGTFSQGGRYNLGGTAGQPDAGTHSGGQYGVQGGFWNSSSVSYTVQWNTPLAGVGAALAAPGIYFTTTNAMSMTQVFVGGTGGIKQAYDGNGPQLWNQSVGAAIQNRGPIVPVPNPGNPPTNVAFFTSADGYVNALQAATGAPFWSGGAANGVQIGPSAVAGPAYQPARTGGPANNLLFAGTYNAASATNRLVALNANTGAQVWEFTNGGVLGIIPTTPAVDWNGNTVYFGTSPVGGQGGGIWAVNSTNGTIRWSKSNLGSVVSSAPSLASDGQTLYIGTVNGSTHTLYELNAANGNVRAQFVVPNEAGAGALYGAPWPQGNDVFTSAGNRLYALTYTDGGSGTGTLAPRAGWGSPYNGANGYASIPGGGTPLVLVQKGAIYVGGNDSYFYKLNLADGTLNKRLLLSPLGAVSDGTYDVKRDAFYFTHSSLLYAVQGSW